MEIIESQVGRGSFVITTVPDVDSGLEIERVIDVVRLREILEAGALHVAARDPDADREVVRVALERLREAVEAGRNTIDSDIALHRAILVAAGSTALLRVFDDAYESILRSIQLSPRANTMGSQLLREHQEIADGILTGDLDRALAASHTMHEEHRELLRRFLD